MVVVEELTSKTIGYLVPKRVKVQLLSEEGRVLSETSAYVLVKPGLDEPTKSDALIEELGIVIVHAKRGLWRHIRGPESILRPSATTS